MSKMKCAVISDGYNVKAETDGEKDFPPVKFTFRPCTHMDRMKWSDADTEAGESRVKQTEAYCEVMENHIVAWDAKEQVKGDKVKDSEITEDSLLRLSQATFMQMALIVLGITARTPAERKKVIEDNKKRVMEDLREVSGLDSLEEQEKN